MMKACGVPKISVIIPTLNEEKLLPGMLAQFTPSLLEAHDLELVVSDGGSSDRTLRIARERAHQVVENGVGVRQTIAMGRNRGARGARGAILVFLAADTLLADPESFFRRIEREIKSPEIAALTCRVTVYPEEETAADRAYHGFYNWLFALMNRVGMGMGRGECHVMRREIFDRVGGYAEHVAAGEDYELYARLEKLGRVKFLEDVRVYESPRRYRRYGYARVTASWFANFLAVFFLGRSLRKEWRAIR
jgi:glycosyltransferase involved in cell wall biosynthesis